MLTLVGVASLAHGLPWAVRALAPAAVWTACVVRLHVVWEPWLLPRFLAPPP